jgi:hypothetical protein
MIQSSNSFRSRMGESAVLPCISTDKTTIDIYSDLTSPFRSVNSETSLRKYSGYMRRYVLAVLRYIQKTYTGPPSPDNPPAPSQREPREGEFGFLFLLFLYFYLACASNEAGINLDEW